MSNGIKSGSCDVAPTAVENVRQAEEQCKRTNELLNGFENLLREANLYSTSAEVVNKVVGADSPEDLSLGHTVSRVNHQIRMNANRLGDLLDVMKNELI